MIRLCADCGQSRPVVDDGAFAVHFLGNGDVCPGSALHQEDFDADPVREAAIAYVMRAGASRLAPPRLE